MKGKIEEGRKTLEVEAYIEMDKLAIISKYMEIENINLLNKMKYKVF
ncbi:MAG: hypothetical protein ACP5IB_01475 [Thermoplasmata archaeon]